MNHFEHCSHTASKSRHIENVTLGVLDILGLATLLTTVAIAIETLVRVLSVAARFIRATLRNPFHFEARMVEVPIRGLTN